MLAVWTNEMDDGDRHTHTDRDINVNKQYISWST